MPIISIHGVGARINTPEYDSAFKLKKKLCNTFLKPNLPVVYQNCGELEHCYWGDFGAKFRWNTVGLPQATDEHLGSEKLSRDEENELLSDPLLMLDALIAANAMHDDVGNYAPVLSQLIEKSPDIALKELIDESYDTPVSLTETLGGTSSIRSMLDGAWIRITGAPTSLVMGLIRPNLHKKAIGFMGDVLAMMGHPTNRDNAIGKIRDDISNAQNKAQAEKTIVIAHSMGGILVADMLLRYGAPKIDLLITVASQIAPIAELGHFSHNVINQLAISEGNKVGPKSKCELPSVDKWINVYAPADVLSFRAGDVFSNVEDFSFTTGANPLSAHSDYFHRASFYVRLAKRLKQ